MESSRTSLQTEPVKVYVSRYLALSLHERPLAEVLKGDHKCLMGAFCWSDSQLGMLWSRIYLKQSVDVPYKQHLVCYRFAARKKLLQGVRFEMSPAVSELINQS